MSFRTCVFWNTQRGLTGPRNYWNLWKTFENWLWLIYLQHSVTNMPDKRLLTLKAMHLMTLIRGLNTVVKSKEVMPHTVPPAYSRCHHLPMGLLPFAIQQQHLVGRADLTMPPTIIISFIVYRALGSVFTPLWWTDGKRDNGEESKHKKVHNLHKRRPWRKRGNIQTPLPRCDCWHKRWFAIF